MTRYRVYLEAVASAVVEVEAENEDDAVEKAFEKAPRASWDWPDMGDWYFPGDNSADNRTDYIEEID